MCDLAGIPAPADLDSRSLVPLLLGEAPGWDDETISQFGLRNLMIKRGQLKYQSYGPDMPEVLFDLGHDPTETTDFATHIDYQDDISLFRGRRAGLGYESMVNA
jgi:choline-sulfatase